MADPAVASSGDSASTSSLLHTSGRTEGIHSTKQINLMKKMHQEI